MMTTFRAVAIAAIIGLALGKATSAASDIQVGPASRTALTLTVYNQDLALVAERRRFEAPQGRSALHLTGISPMILPGSVDLTAAGFDLIEQSYHFDLLTPRRLLEASLGQTVRIARINPATGEESIEEATVLSVEDGAVFKIGERIETTRDLPGRIVFDRIPAGLSEAPALRAVLDGPGGEGELSLGYLTGGLGWQADYIARLDEAAGRMALTGMITLTNSTRTAFAGARLRLVAGTVNRGAAPLPRERAMVAQMAEAAALPAAQAAGDLRLYDLGREVDLTSLETKQVPLVAANQVAFRLEHHLPSLGNILGRTGESGPVKAETRVLFANAAGDGLGQPLPAGLFRAYGRLGEGAPVFLGEDRIGHTAVGEDLEIALGRAFDITGEARQTAFEQLSGSSFEAAQTITVANAKDRSVEVLVGANFPPGWKILEESAAHRGETANRIVWMLPVPAGGEATLTYRVRVTAPARR